MWFLNNASHTANIQKCEKVAPMVKLTHSFIKTLCLLFCLTGFTAQAAEFTMFFHNDALGSPILATDQSGNVLGKENYTPFGERRIKDPAASGNRLWFTGKPQNENTGLTYLHNRYYSPDLGRFISVDPVDPIVGNVHHFNRYAYANNNPSKFIDPDGELPVLLAPIAWNVARYVATEAAAMIVEEFAPDIPLSKKGLLKRAVRDGIKHMPGSVVKTGIKKGNRTGEPNSIYIQTTRDGKKAVQSTVYDCNGKACAHVDWKKHSYGSNDALPGHGHRINPPGTPEGFRNAHGPGAEHISPENVPSAWKKLPTGIVPAE